MVVRIPGVQYESWPLHGGGMHASGNNTGTLAATGTTPRTVTLLKPICTKRFSRHYSKTSQHYRRTTTVVHQRGRDDVRPATQDTYQVFYLFIV